MNWSNVGSWSATSGGSSNGSAQPTSSDNVTFDSNSPATVTVAATASANTLTLNKASLVITLNGGSLTASSTTTVSTAATVNKTASETFTINGCSITAALTGTAKVILASGTWTGSNSGSIANDLDIQGNITMTSSLSRYQTGNLTYVSGTITNPALIVVGNMGTLTLTGFPTITGTFILGGNLTLVGSITCSGTSSFGAALTAGTSETITLSGGSYTLAACSGTVKFIMTGGTWASVASGTVANSVDIQGNIAIAGVRYGSSGTGGKTLTYISGTITVTGTFTIAGSCTLNTNGITFNNLTWTTGGGTITLTSNMLVNGSVTSVAAVLTINKTTSETFTIAGGLSLASNTITGTAKIILTGGTWSGSSTIFLTNDLDIQGNVTVSGSVGYDRGTITYISGTVTTSGSTLFTSANGVTFNTNGISWNNITISNTSLTYTINSLLTATGTLTLGTAATVTFAGTAGFTVGTLTSAVTAAQTITLKNSVTYTITTALTCFTSRTGSILLFTSDDGTLKATLTLQNGATCNCLASFTRIDASNGRPIDTFEGTLTSCNGIRVMTDLVTVAG